MNIVLPKEHGSWMMFFLPVILGIIFTTLNLSQVFFIIGWFSLFLASTPFFNMFRNKNKKTDMSVWLLIYSGIAAVFIIPLIYFNETLLLIGLSIIPFVIINLVFIKHKNERHLINDFSGILIFCIGGLAVYYLGGGNILSKSVYKVIALPTFFFFGSALYVKSLIRERRNRSFRRWSHIYHGFFILIPILTGAYSLIYLFLPSVIIDWFTPRKQPFKPYHAGIIEIINGMIFIALCGIFLT